MLIFEGKQGRVEKGWITGFKFTIKATGRSVGATPFMKDRMAKLHYGLKERGFDSMNDAAVKAEFWSYMIDLASQAPNGLGHRAEAMLPIDEVVDMIISMLRFHK